MLIVRTLPELRAACAELRRPPAHWRWCRRWGPCTRGTGRWCGAGLRRARPTVASIFVNPLQFAPSEDCRGIRAMRRGTLRRWRRRGARWPGCRMWQRCIRRARRPRSWSSGPAERWEGDARPGHFRGVATVCAKLFGQVRPDRAYFGEKDWQQLQVVKRMVADLLLPLEIIGVQTVRETSGLAMSSRNRFLSAAERGSRRFCMRRCRRRCAHWRAVPPAMRWQPLGRRWSVAGFGLDYLALVDGPGLVPIDVMRAGARLIAAARLGSVRLLDNVAAG